MKMQLPILTLLASLLLATSSYATPINVRSGSVIIDFNATALGSLNLGSDPNIPALILEYFFSGTQDSSRTRTQIISDLTSNLTAYPPNSLKFWINGDTVTNLTGRTRKPSTFSYDPANVQGTATGDIGLTGVTRFIGDFTGIFVLGDFVVRYDATRGWLFVNNFDFANVPAFETSNVTVTATGSKLVISGNITISQEMDLYFFPGDHGVVVGDFRLETPLVVSPPAIPMISNLGASGFQIGVVGKGNSIYQLQYSTNLIDWITVGPTINGTGNLIQWTDNGPPLTPSKPSASVSRYYRFTEN